MRKIGIVETAKPFELLAVGRRAEMYGALTSLRGKGFEVEYVYVEPEAVTPEGTGLYRVCAATVAAPVGRVLMLEAAPA